MKWWPRKRWAVVLVRVSDFKIVLVLNRYWLRSSAVLTLLSIDPAVREQWLFEVRRLP